VFGPPNREADLPVLEETHLGLRRLRLLRKDRETLRTTARGRALLEAPDALLAALRDGIGGDEPFNADAWPLVEAAVRDDGPINSERLAELIEPRLWQRGWQGDLRAAITPLLWRAEGYGLLRTDWPVTYRLTDAARRLAGPGRAAETGDAALILDAELVNGRTAEVPIAELDLRVGQRIAYVFDFGDEWRVRLTVRDRVVATGEHPRVLELRGTPPPQYA
jgi:Plasmid pRiA4b ORF-3-like protein